MTTTHVKTYNRRKNGKIFKVRAYLRKNRSLGKKIHYSPVGEFYVAHDDMGNFRGSKVVAEKKPKTTKKATASFPKPKRRSLPVRKVRKRRAALDSGTVKSRALDNKYFEGEITFDEWMSSKSEIPNKNNQ